MRVNEHTLFSGTATATTNHGAVQTTAGSAVAYLNVTAASGTTPTLDVKIQGQDPVSGTWFDTGSAFAQKTTTGSERISITSLPDATIRAVSTITGTTPSFTYTVSLITKQGY